MSRSRQTDDVALAAILARQYQVIRRSQAVASGMTESALDYRLRAGGPWQRLLPGVFLTVTGSPTSDQRDTAALLYAGPESLLTGAAALRLWSVRATRPRHSRDQGGACRSQLAPPVPHPHRLGSGGIPPSAPVRPARHAMKPRIHHARMG
jgi:hypothetical protein